MKSNLALLSLLAAFTLPGSAGAAPVGLPTYEATAMLDVLRGGSQPVVAQFTHHGYNGLGHGRAATGPINDGYPHARPSEAEATATAAQLKALSVASGSVQYDPNTLPHVQAFARATTTTFWQFGAPWQMQFTALLDGTLSGAFSFFEAPSSRNLARVTFGLDLLAANGDVLRSIFQVHAEVMHVSPSNILGFYSGSSGFADAGLWTSEIVKVSDDGNRLNRPLAYVVGYADLIDTTITAGTGDVFGFRWYLETESWIEGYAVGAEFVADFGHTAGIDFALTAEQRAQLGMVQLLSFPGGGPTNPMPLPGTPALLLLALGAIAVWRRTLPGTYPT